MWVWYIGGREAVEGKGGCSGVMLFKKGEGCGACYKVKCLDHSICSKRAVTVIVTDECPGCPSDRTHFDLSGSAFGRMAFAGENGQLRNRGEIPVVYRRYGSHVHSHLHTPFYVFFSFLNLVGLEYYDR